ncbi:MAG: peptidoglycan DD-metalloendopeptidase family protein [Deltaproteobacteria bacterium]|nr:MAG: peptidoglycan DD-metalloendopeptidase family protein [Deltaproteobacteria bacterium]
MRRAARPGVRSALALAALLAVAAPGRADPDPAAAPPGAEDPAQELQEIRRAIEKRRELLTAFDREERGLFETLQQMDESRAQLAREADVARRRAAEARSKLGEIEAEASSVRSRRARLAKAMSQRAVALYKTGETGPLQILFSSNSLRDLLERIRGLRTLLAHDQQLLTRFRSDTVALEAAQVEMRETSAERDRALRLAQARAREVERERAAKSELLDSVREDRARERAVLNELEAAALALEETLANLRSASLAPSGPRRTSAFSSLRGSLALPVSGSRITRGFGRVLDAQFRTATFRKGVDFEASIGEPVRAVAAGDVRFAGWFRGYGKMLILDHGDEYFTVSAHLGEVYVDVGDSVQAGEPIGAVGDTGSLSGPLLYFEIRRGGEPLDPSEWLRPEAAG